MLSKAFKELIAKVKTVWEKAQKYLAEVMDDLKKKLDEMLGKKSSKRLETLIASEGEVIVKQGMSPLVPKSAKKRGALPKRAGKVVFTRLQHEIATEARKILNSPKLRKLRAAHANGVNARVMIGGRRIQYETDLPEYGMSLFGQNGFCLSRHAFSSQKELTKTILHELHRLRTTKSKVFGGHQELVDAESAAARVFREELYELGKKAKFW